MEYEIRVPPTREVGSFKTIVTSTQESIAAEALEIYNNVRKYSGMTSLSRMPNGTQYKKLNVSTTLERKIEKLIAFNGIGKYEFFIHEISTGRDYGPIRADTGEKANIVIKRQLGNGFKANMKLPSPGLPGESYRL